MLCVFLEGIIKCLYGICIWRNWGEQWVADFNFVKTFKLLILVIWTSFWHFWKIRKMQLICHTLSLNRHVCIDPVYRQDEYHDTLMHCPIDWLTNINLAFWMKALNCFLGNLLVTITSSLRDSNKLFPWKHCFSWKSYTHFFHAINFSYENSMKVMPIYAKR